MALDKLAVLPTALTPRPNRFNQAGLTLAFLIAGYVVAVSLLHGLRQARFMNGFDLAFYQQAIWNTGQGRFLEVSATDFSRSLLGTDVILIYALFAPFYRLVPATLTLLVLETLVVGLGALPVYWLARDRLGHAWAGVGLAALYLMLPVVQNGNLYELRERPMAGTFLLLTFYLWQKGRLGWAGLVAGLALSCRPENGLVLVMLGLYGWLEGLPGRPGFGWRYIVWPIGLGLTWFGAALLIIRLAAGENGYALGNTFAGGSPLSALLTPFTDPTLGWRQLFPTGDILLGKLLYIPFLLLPFGFLPLFSPRLLLMALPSVGLNLLAGEKRQIQWNPFDYHYQASIIPWLLVATIFSLARFQSRPPARLRRGLLPGLVGLLLALTVTLNLATNLATYEAPDSLRVKNGWGPILRKKEDARWPVALAMLKAVPPDAPLAVTNLLAPQLPPRRELWYLADRVLYSRHPVQEAQFIFANLRDPEEAALVKQLLAGDLWRELDQQAGYILLQRRSPV